MNPTSYNKPASTTLPDTNEDREAMLFDQIRFDEGGPAHDHNAGITTFKDNQVHLILTDISEERER